MKSFDEILEERKRKKENGGTDTPRFDAVFSERARKKASEMYKSFYNELQGFTSNVEEDYNSIGYGSASSLYDKYNSQSTSIRNKMQSFEEYLKANKSYFDSDAYEEMLGKTKEYDSFLKDTADAFGVQKDYFAQWKTEEDYNGYLDYQKEQDELKTLDLDALHEEIANLEKTRNETSEEVSMAINAIPEITKEINRLNSDVQTLRLTAKKTDDESIHKQLEEKEKRLAQYKSDLDKCNRIKADEEARKKSLDGDISGLNAKYNRAKYIQNGINLTNDAMNAEDFDENSGYVSTVINYAEVPFWDFKTRLFSDPYDSTYEYINDVDGMRSHIEHKRDIYSSDNPFDDGVSTWKEKGYHRLKDDEKKIYNYYYSTQGKDKAEEYLNSIQESLYNRVSESMFAKLEGNTFLELVFGVEAGLDQFKSGIENLFNTTDDYIPVNAYQQTSGKVREDLADDSFDFWYNAKTGEWEDTIFGSSLGQAGYDSITTMSNMMPSILASSVSNVIVPGSGAVVGAGLMGASAAGNAYQEMLNLGYDKGQARSYSALVGASEAGLQYLLGGVGKLGGKLSSNVISNMISGIDNAFARTAIKLGGNMLSEGIEESLQEVLTPFFQNLVLYADNDLSDVDWSQVAYSGLLGALSSFMLEGGSTISEGVNIYKSGKAIKNAGQVSNLVKLGKSMSADTVAYELAGKVNENTGAYTIGTLLHEVGADSLSETNLADITATLESRGIAPEYAKVIAKWLNKTVGGETLTKAQQMALEYNEDIGEVIRDVIINKNSTVNQRLQGYKNIVNTTQFNEAVNKLRKQAEKAEKKNAKYAKETDNEVDASVENRFAVSEDGQTVNKNTDEAINVVEIASIKDGKMTLKLDNGETVDANDIGFATEDEGIIYSAVLDMGVNAEVANSIVKGFDPADGVSAMQYSLGVKEAYKYGRYNIPVREMSAKGFSADLTVAQRNHAYNLGRSDANADAIARQKAISEAVKNASTKNNEKGKVHFNGDRSTLSNLQKTSLETLDKIAETLGVSFHIYVVVSVEKELSYLLFSYAGITFSYCK